MTRIKICGLKDSENIEAAVRSGADFVGFVFHPPSPRYITPADAAILVRDVPGSVQVVGLFVDPPDQDIAAALAAMRLDMIQLHGAETPGRVSEILEKFSRPVIKAIPVGGAEDILAAAQYEAVADWLLFDARSTDASLPGGTGKCFDWSVLEGRRFKKPWMLSGGLTVDNVSKALSALQPDAVDVSSGVESERGKKDPVKIKTFIRVVKTND